MNYRSPAHGMARRLTGLREELHALREKRGKPAPARPSNEVAKLSKKAARLERLADVIAREAGQRALTPRETASIARQRRVGAVVLCVSVVVALVYVAACGGDVELVWMMGIGFGVTFGAVSLLGTRVEERRRRGGEIEPDDFTPSD